MPTEHLGEFAVTYENGNLAQPATIADEQCHESMHGHRCAYPTGHATLAVDGAVYAHHVPNTISWDPEPAQPRCESRPGPGGWTTPETRCELAAGHEGDHREGPIGWHDARPCPARERIGTTALACGLGEGHAGRCEWPDADDALMRELGNHRPVFLPVAEPAVRVRFIDLPALPANPELRENHPARGLLSGVMRPGGFALVVDRFRDRQHRDDERGTWEAFGEKIGATHVLLYVGELDTDDLLER